MTSPATTTSQHTVDLPVYIYTVIAGESIERGEHIHLSKDGFARSTDCHEPVGIADPFIDRDIKVGESFKLFAYPGERIDFLQFYQGEESDVCALGFAIAANSEASTFLKCFVGTAASCITPGNPVLGEGGSFTEVDGEADFDGLANPFRIKDFIDGELFLVVKFPEN